MGVEHAMSKHREMTNKCTNNDKYNQACSFLIRMYQRLGKYRFMATSTRCVGSQTTKVSTSLDVWYVVRVHLQGEYNGIWPSRKLSAHREPDGQYTDGHVSYAASGASNLYIRSFISLH